jgi:hypothetical protein
MVPTPSYRSFRACQHDEARAEQRAAVRDMAARMRTPVRRSSDHIPMRHPVTGAWVYRR